MPLKLNKKKFLVHREMAKKFWENNGATPDQIAKKYRVSLSTAYRWIKGWKEEEQ